MASGSVDIYTGVWVNWAQGSVKGATITLGSQSSAVLTAFIATFLTLVAARLWAIIAFIAHQLCAKDENVDGLHHQRRVILRNSETPTSAAYAFFYQLWYWPKRYLLRTLPWAALAILYVVAAAAVSIFGTPSLVNPAGRERLVVGPHCGFTFLNGTEKAASQATYEKLVRDDTAATTYSQNCHGSNSGGTFQCDLYPTNRIPFTTRQVSKCPFKDVICDPRNGTSIMEMDTGFLDSLSIFGVNAPPEERISFRQVSTCTTLETRGYILHGKNRHGIPELGLNYGPTIFPYSPLYPFTYTWITNTSLNLIPFTIRNWHASPDDTSEWEPIPEFQTQDADVDIIFLENNGVAYFNPIDDPVFSAHQYDEAGAALEYVHYYGPDFYIRPFACSTQYQIRNEANKKVSQPSSRLETFRYGGVDALQLTPAQYNVALRLNNATFLTSFQKIIYERGKSALIAAETMRGTFIDRLPDNQWEIELQGWMRVGLIRMQQEMQEYATGPRQPYPALAYELRYPTPASKAQCNSQITRLTLGTTSFSVLGLALTIGLGCLIIATSMLIDTIVGFIQRRWFHGHVTETRRLWWILDDNLHLQKMLFEKLGLGSWKGSRKSSVPNADMNDTFGKIVDRDTDNPSIGRLGMPTYDDKEAERSPSDTGTDLSSYKIYYNNPPQP